ncbi:MAG: hypothetical protein AABY22_14300 [Nanoarchaeota archaeon]
MKILTPKQVKVIEEFGKVYKRTKMKSDKQIIQKIQELKKEKALFTYRFNRIHISKLLAQINILEWVLGIKDPGLIK